MLGCGEYFQDMFVWTIVFQGGLNIRLKSFRAWMPVFRVGKFLIRMGSSIPGRILMNEMSLNERNCLIWILEARNF